MKTKVKTNCKDRTSFRITPYLNDKLKSMAIKKGMKREAFCNTIISNLPQEIITVLCKKEYFYWEEYVYNLYADYNGKCHSNESEENSLSPITLRLNCIVQNYINLCRQTWNTTYTDTFILLISIAFLYDSNENLLKQKLGFYVASSSGEKNIVTNCKSKSKKPKLISPPYVCYQHGNKENTNIKLYITDILKNMPQNINAVYEPFAGMLGITLNVLNEFRGREFEYNLSELNKDISNLYFCIKSKPDKLISESEKLIKELKTNKECFETIKKKHIIPDNPSKSKLNLRAAAEHMYLDAVSVQHKGKNLSKNGNDYIDIINQIQIFQKYICNIVRMHEYLKLVNFKCKEAIKVISGIKNISNALLILDPPYLQTSGYGTNFSFKEQEEIAKVLRSLNDSNVFLLFCRFTETRNKKQTETYESVKNREKNGEFKIGDDNLIGFYNLEYGIKAKKVGKQFYYKKVKFDNKGTMEAIISNKQFEGFSPF